MSGGSYRENSSYTSSYLESSTTTYGSGSTSRGVSDAVTAKHRNMVESIRSSAKGSAPAKSSYPSAAVSSSSSPKLGDDSLSALWGGPPSSKHTTPKRTSPYSRPFEGSVGSIPPGSVEAVHVAVDNSGSNSGIARGVRDSAGYFAGILSQLSRQTAVSWNFFSDHCDGFPYQYGGWGRFTDESSETSLRDRLDVVSPQGGGDFPEAIECVMNSASKFSFGDIPRKDRIFILVTDSVSHGMGFGRDSDDGCPHGIDPMKAARDLHSVYGEVVIIGSGTDRQVRSLQMSWLSEATDEEVQRCMIDLSGVESLAHRNGLVTNAILFAILRRRGLQTVQIFLSQLYGRWLGAGLFGDQTETKARERITHMAESYLSGLATPKEIRTLLENVLI